MGHDGTVWDNPNCLSYHNVPWVTMVQCGTIPSVPPITIMVQSRLSVLSQYTMGHNGTVWDNPICPSYHNNGTVWDNPDCPSYHNIPWVTMVQCGTIPSVPPITIMVQCGTIPSVPPITIMVQCGTIPTVRPITIYHGSQWYSVGQSQLSVLSQCTMGHNGTVWDNPNCPSYPNVPWVTMVQCGTVPSVHPT